MVGQMIEMERSYLTAEVFREILASSNAVDEIGQESGIHVRKPINASWAHCLKGQHCLRGDRCPAPAPRFRTQPISVNALWGIADRVQPRPACLSCLACSPLPFYETSRPD